MASKAMQDFTTDLECSICLQQYKEPRVLPCNHSFCLVCLVNWVQESRDDSQLTCPLCNDVSPLPPGGVNDVKSNVYLISQLESLQKLRASENATETNVTEHGGTRREEKDAFCVTHPAEKIRMYCRDCRVTACSSCVLTRHRMHNLAKLSKQAQLNRQQLHGIVEQIDKLLEQMKEYIAARVKHNDKSADDLRHIKQMIDATNEQLSQRQSDLFSDLDQIEAQREKTLSKIADEQQFILTDMTTLHSDAMKILHSSSDHDTVEQFRGIESRLKSVHCHVAPTYSWVCTNTHENTNRSTDHRIAKVICNVDVSGMSVSDIRPILRRIPLVVKDTPVMGMAILDQTLWVVHCEKPELHAIPLTPEPDHLPQSFTVKGMKKPHNLVRYPPRESQLVASCHKKRLLWIKIKGTNDLWHVTLRRKVKLNYVVHGLATSGDVLLACDGRSIHLFSTSGQEIHTVSLPETVRPWKAVPQLKSTTYVVADIEDKQIALVSQLEGKVKRTYNGQDVFDLLDITCDDHSIYISDDKHRVQQLALDGSYKGELLNRQHGVTFPSSLCMDQSGLLYVAHGNEDEEAVEVLVVQPSVVNQLLAVKHTAMELILTCS